ncbi:hypothetical protein [uncultured Jannaschia sp.]|uniref:hypothetical protein n=1 Tax=uncultured Jannaschia sp. TaxID=293347 RepID=UPI0026134A3B|nr:hypothetical protein [uncultured Jannaschia sp.]
MELKRQVVAEYNAGETLHGLSRRHDVCRTPIEHRALEVAVERVLPGFLDQAFHPFAMLLLDLEAGRIDLSISVCLSMPSLAFSSLSAKLLSLALLDIFDTALTI